MSISSLISYFNGSVELTFGLTAQKLSWSRWSVSGDIEVARVRLWQLMLHTHIVSRSEQFLDDAVMHTVMLITTVRCMSSIEPQLLGWCAELGCLHWHRMKYQRVSRSRYTWSLASLHYMTRVPCLKGSGLKWHQDTLGTGRASKVLKCSHTL